MYVLQNFIQNYDKNTQINYLLTILVYNMIDWRTKNDIAIKIYLGICKKFMYFSYKIRNAKKYVNV